MNRAKMVCGFLFASMFLALTVSVQAQETSGTRRFALVVGANNGGRERVTLRYAARDARAMAGVMQQLGGLVPTDHAVLIDPTRAELLAALDRFSPEIAQAHSVGQRVEFLFYYSGHSDEQGILLHEERIGYADIRSRLGALPSDVRIAVLDSCASGSLTRMKGGQHQAPFLMDASSDVRGHAFLTSSSSDEAAQESDRIGASFFTHYLVSGLRGAADFNGDRRVTLNEAYRFAFDETLRRTETTQGGAQHPSYDIQLAGSGDLVMTDLRQTSATLSLARALEARIYLRDATGQLVAELFKPAGRSVDLALSPGHYEIVADRNGTLSRGSVDLSDGARTELSAQSLTAVGTETTVARGDATPATDPATSTDMIAADETSDGYRVLPFATSLVPPLDTNSIETQRKVINYVAFNWLLGRSDRIEGLQLGLGANWAVEQVAGVQLAVGANWIDQNLRGVQASVGFNHVGGEARGVQSSSGVNHVAGHMIGAQLGAGLNLTRRLSGGQFGMVNVASQADGVQLATVNVTSDSLRGAQVGLVNVTGGRARGVQLGLFNYADEADVSIGLIGLTRKGGVHPMLWTSNTGAFNFGLRFDANYTYTFFALGGHPSGAGAAMMVGLGVGVKIPIEDVIWLDFDLSEWGVAYGGDFDRGAQLSTARLLLRVQPAPHLGFFGGPTFNLVMNQGQENDGLKPGYGPTLYRHHDTDPRVDLVIYPGFAAGVMF